jgi:peptide/nickel transport system substrate-binding protein
MGMMSYLGPIVLAAVLSFSPLLGSELRFAVRAEPKSFDPLLAEEEVSETIAYLTAGVLIRFNRETQRLEPELATSWKVLDNARRIDFTLRSGVRFCDGGPFGPADVVATVGRITNPDLHSGIADTFRSAGGTITARPTEPNGVSLSFSKPVAGLETLFDQLPIVATRRVPPESAVLGPFMLAEYKSGQYVILKRNPHYWKVDTTGKKLPLLDAVRLDIQANREIELLRFRRGELHFVDKVEPDAFARLSKEFPAAALNAGASLDTEFFWLNQSPSAPAAPYKKQWFQSKLFRQALSAAVNREDVVRLVYRGYAHPAIGSVSPANRFWSNAKLAPQKYDPQLALKLLRQDGFRLQNNTLRDHQGNQVEFSLLTNAGSNTRTQIGTMLQQDLAKIGIHIQFLPVEFQSLIERITRSQQYEACLLGFSNIEVDPNGQMNIWMSSGNLHAWNPSEKKPATSWEADIDRLMEQQHAATDAAVRKKAFDRVQEIVYEQQPIVYLVNPDVLVAVSPLLRNIAATPLPPHLYWNIEHLFLAGPGDRRTN